ncbi:hypothetical protein [Herbiconiux solani]|uniref:hypothetical protein n=1 Tax=Herbiconiux solani TaxID=661329 RepID=UPI0008246A18|nr:hypothetical protein [Herbiconiux solani]
MTEIIVAEDAELAAVTELKQRLPDTGEVNPIVATSIPATQPPEFFRVIVTGGTDRDLVTDNPSITVEAYALREARAERMAARAHAVLLAAARAGSMGGVPCYQAQSFARPGNLPNPLVPDRRRYTFTISADLRMAAV